MTLYDKYLEKLADKEIMRPFGDKKKKKPAKETSEYSETGEIDPTPLSEKVK